MGCANLLIGNISEKNLMEMKEFLTEREPAFLTPPGFAIWALFFKNSHFQRFVVKMSTYSYVF